MAQLDFLRKKKTARLHFPALGATLTVFMIIQVSGLKAVSRADFGKVLIVDAKRLRCTEYCSLPELRIPRQFFPERHEV